MRTILAMGLVCAASSAHADGLDQVPKLGFAIGYGDLPVHAQDTRATSVGLGVEHPVLGATRVFATWEWLWLSDGDPAQAMATGRDLVNGSGQRVNLGLRRALIVGGDGTLRYFFDGELGGGAMLASDDTMGTHVVGDGLVGVRVGFDLRDGNSSSRVFEGDLHANLIVVPHDYGVTFGIGMAWGD
jgi:hypothetical protein